tara:strand:- start:162 stop:383 length:222 start_codon:yes stop_codon:yes gene_type:complete
MTILNNIGFKNVRGKKLQTPSGLSIFIVNPAEGSEIEGNPTVSFEVEFSNITITQPIEGEELTGDPTINFEIE